MNREFERLLSLICGSIQEFALYDTSKIAVSISRSRRNGRAGTLAYVVPLRYVGGSKERKGRRWGVPGLYSYESTQVDRDQPHAMYIMTFLVPKFFSLKSRDRLETMVHELYHLHPSMRGDLRRFAAPHIHHGPTPAQYDRKVKSLCAELLQAIPNIEQHPLLAQNEDQVGTFRAKRFNIPRQVFKPKPFGLILAASVIGAICFGVSAHSGQVPVVIIKDGAMRVAPQATAGSEASIKRGDRFEAYRLSDDRQWVWVGNGSVKGWVHREFIQSQNLDQQLGLRGAYVDPKIPNKLGEKKVTEKDDDDPIKETTPALKARMPKVDVVPPVPAPAAVPGPDAVADDIATAEPSALTGSAKSAAGTSGELDLRGDLEEDPNADQLKDLKLSPEEKSHIEEGERVSKAQIKAQTRLSPIKKNDFEFKNDKARGAVASEGVVTWEDSYDPERDRANVFVAGKLFERPDELSRRYGILEPGDEVLPLAHTEDGKWMRVRLQETGEEGWYPAPSIRVKQADRVVATNYLNSLQLHGGWASRGHNLGGGVGYHFAFGFDDKNRFWTVGIDASYWLGENLSYLGRSYQARYMAFQALGRYNIPSASSSFGAMVEGGLGFYQALVQTGGIDEAVLTASGLTTQTFKKLVPVLGVGVRYGIAKHFDVIALARFQMSSSSSVYAGFGLGGNF